MSATGFSPPATANGTTDTSMSGGLTLSSSEPNSRSQRGTRMSQPAAPAAPTNDMDFDFDYRDNLQDARSTGTSSGRAEELEELLAEALE